MLLLLVVVVLWLSAEQHPAAGAALQVLAALLLDSPARPGLEALGQHAAAAYQAAVQVVSGMQPSNYDPELQRSAAAVLARLAMEPTVEPLLLHASTSSSGSSSSRATWLQLLAQELTVGRLFGQLLPAGLHCPVMGVEETDAVQYLQELYKSSELLQPLQHTRDVRAIRAVQALPPDQQQQQQQQQQQPQSAACQDLGFSLVLRDMPKRCRAVAELVGALEQQLGLPAGANLYYTPAGAQALKAHYDDHCVFVLQLAGSKTWLLAPPQQPQQQLPLTYQPRDPVDVPLAARWQQQQCNRMIRQHDDGRHHQEAAPGGSLHLSVGVEVEPRFTVQGYLHCLIEYAGAKQRLQQQQQQQQQQRKLGG
ncbi:hypothetical protein COO60DRAFT_1637891 [Scenedesmus sp. NREL 46B-D3]|nr:hypothetical protein COO60DRAFT_1637891 [Scenedesmus sp. NREL 46B-D3]